MRWLTMETAPKDGTKILLRVDGVAIEGDYGKYPDCKGRDSEGNGWRVTSLASHGCGCCAGDNDAPTHWCPLPSE